MKIIFGFIAVFLVVTTLAIDNRTRTLSEWFNDVLNFIKNKRLTLHYKDPIKKFTEEHSKYKIKLIMKFSKNEDKPLNFAEAMILIYGSILRHFDHHKQQEAWNVMVDLLINYYDKDDFRKNLDCYKTELNKIATDASHVDDSFYDSRCEETVDMEGLDKHFSAVESAYGNLTTMTGGIIDRRKFKKTLLTFVVLAGQNHEERFNDKNLLIINLKSYFNGAFENVLSTLNNRKSTKTNHEYYRSQNGR